MSKYILHGGFTSEDNEQNTKFFTECFSDTPQNGNVLIVMFASENDGDEGYYNNLCDRLRKYSNKQITFEKANRDEFISQVKKASTIFFQGGDTNRLISALKKYENLRELFLDKTIIGSSAGAYALGRFGTSHDEVHIDEGLGILPLRVVCHYQSDKLPPSDTSLEEINNTHQELELVLLKDYQYEVFESPKQKVILVDAVNTLVDKETGMFKEMYTLLEQYPNKKIVLTNADDEQMEKFGLDDLPYEVFTLKHNPNKPDPIYFQTMLKHFDLKANEVIYFEHNESAVKSAQSIGIKTYHYDPVQKDLDLLQSFLNQNI